MVLVDCSSVSCIPCKLTVESRGSIRFKFDCFGKTTSHMVICLIYGTSVFVILVAIDGHCLDLLVHCGLRGGPAPRNTELGQ